MSMNNSLATLRLMTWLSPAFPVGSFSYSSGLEQAIDAGLVCEQESLEEWLRDLLSFGFLWSDAVLLAQMLKAEPSGQKDIAELALALCQSRERYLETTAQGRAFLTAAKPWFDAGEHECLQDHTLPVALGMVASNDPVLGKPDCHGEVIAAFLHASVSNQIQAALRLMKLGQSKGVVTLANLEETVVLAAQRACGATLDDLGTIGIMADIQAMNHETLSSRLFRT